MTDPTRTFRFTELDPTLATAKSHGIGTDGPEQVVYFGICSPAQPLEVGRVVSVWREGRSVVLEETRPSGLTSTVEVLSATSKFWAAPVPPADPDPARVAEISTEIATFLRGASDRAAAGAAARTVRVLDDEDGVVRTRPAPDGSPAIAAFNAACAYAKDRAERTGVRQTVVRGSIADAGPWVEVFAPTGLTAI